MSRPMNEKHRAPTRRFVRYTVTLPVEAHARIKAQADELGQNLNVWFNRGADAWYTEMAAHLEADRLRSPVRIAPPETSRKARL